MSAAQRIAETRKAVAALSASAAAMVTAGLITGSTAVWVTGALAAASAGLATWAAPRNADRGGRDAAGGP